MARPRKYSDEQVAEVRRLLARGAAHSAVTSQTGVDRRTVEDVAQDRGTYSEIAKAAAGPPQRSRDVQARSRRAVQQRYPGYTPWHSIGSRYTTTSNPELPGPLVSGGVSSTKGLTAIPRREWNEGQDYRETRLGEGFTKDTEHRIYFSVPGDVTYTRRP